jgi:beta-glucosidase
MPTRSRFPVSIWPEKKRKGWLCVFLSVLAIADVRAQQQPTYMDAAASPEARIDSLLASMTLDEKIQALGSDPSVPRLGLRLSGHIEGLHGVALGGPGDWGRVRNPDGTTRREPIPTTQFPQAVGLGETWDVDVVREVAAIEAQEARYLFHSPKYRRGGIVVRAPNADLARDPRWGRTEESYGEDPYLTGSLATAFVRGLQGEDPTYWQAAALLKHFMANSNEYRRERSSSNFGERLMREYYSVPFRMAIVDGGARAYMAAYNGWNGIPMAINPILKSMTIAEWHEDGIICTDGGAMTQLVTTHAAVPTLDAAAAAAIHAGINQFLDQQRRPVRDAIQHNLLTEADIDATLRGSYRVMIHLGLLDPPDRVPYATIHGDEPWLGEEHREAVRRVTQKSIVLLKNERATLPLDRRKLKSVAVIGPFADQVLLDWYSGTPPYTVSPLDGIREALGPLVNVQFSTGQDAAQAVRMAKSADTVVVIAGNHPTCNARWARCPDPSDGKEGIDRESLELSQESLIRKIHAANPHTVVVLIASFPYTINWTQEHVPAIVLMTHNSQESGHALADVLLGGFNPAGRLVHTWPRSITDLPPMPDYDIGHGRTYLYFKGRPLYPFGFGLSYTRFRYSALQTDSPVLPADGSIDIRLNVTNAGSRDGEEVVQLYTQLPGSKVSRPQRSLQGFRRIAIKAGETKPVHFTLLASQLAYWNDTTQGFKVEDGKVRLLVGASSSDIRLSRTICTSGGTVCNASR